MGGAVQRTQLLERAVAVEAPALDHIDGVVLCLVVHAQPQAAVAGDGARRYGALVGLIVGITLPAGGRLGVDELALGRHHLAGRAGVGVHREHERGLAGRVHLVVVDLVAHVVVLAEDRLVGGRPVDPVHLLRDQVLGREGLGPVRGDVEDLLLGGGIDPPEEVPARGCRGGRAVRRAGGGPDVLGAGHHGAALPCRVGDGHGVVLEEDGVEGHAPPGRPAGGKRRLEGGFGAGGVRLAVRVDPLPAQELVARARGGLGALRHGRVAREDLGAARDRAAHACLVDDRRGRDGVERVVEREDGRAVGGDRALRRGEVVCVGVARAGVDNTSAVGSRRPAVTALTGHYVGVTVAGDRHLEAGGAGRAALARPGGIVLVRREGRAVLRLPDMHNGVAGVVCGLGAQRVGVARVEASRGVAGRDEEVAAVLLEGARAVECAVLVVPAVDGIARRDVADGALGGPGDRCGRLARGADPALRARLDAVGDRGGVVLGKDRQIAARVEAAVGRGPRDGEGGRGADDLGRVGGVDPGNELVARRGDGREGPGRGGQDAGACRGVAHLAQGGAHALRGAHVPAQRTCSVGRGDGGVGAAAAWVGHGGVGPGDARHVGRA